MSNRRLFTILLVVAVAAAAIFYFKSFRGKEDSPASRVVFAVENDLVSLDPIKAQEPYTLRVIGQVLEGLVTLDADGEIAPALAESWTSNDRHDVWTFKIRSGVKFHPAELFGAAGTREVTAEDVAFSFQRVLSKDSYPAFVLADIIKGVSEFQSGSADKLEGVRVLGPGEVEFSLIRPEPQFLNRITSPWFTIYPVEAGGLEAGVFGDKVLVGTGPFRLVSRKDEEVALSRNPDYWKETSGNVEDLQFRVLKNEQIRLTEFQNGRVNVLNLPMKLLPAVAEVDPGTKALELKGDWQSRGSIDSHSTLNSHFLGLNCEKYDKHFRKAVNLAVDRDELIAVITHGTALARIGTLPGALLGYVPPAVPARNLEEARKELALSTLSSAGATLEILVHQKESAEQIGELLQSQLGEIGIAVQLTRLDYNNVIGKMVSGEFGAFVLSFEYVFSAPGTILNNVFHSTKIPVPNFWRYNNPEIDGLLDRFQTISTLDDANELAVEIEKKMQDDPPAAFLFEKITPVLHSQGITGLKFNGHSVPLIWDVRIQ